MLWRPGFVLNCTWETYPPPAAQTAESAGRTKLLFERVLSTLSDAVLLPV
jgi:hypothetical protein